MVSSSATLFRLNPTSLDSFLKYGSHERLILLCGLTHHDDELQHLSLSVKPTNLLGGSDPREMSLMIVPFRSFDG